MPIAPMNEDHSGVLWHNNVRPSRQGADVQSEPEPQSMK